MMTPSIRVTSSTSKLFQNGRLDAWLYSHAAMPSQSPLKINMPLLSSRYWSALPSKLHSINTTKTNPPTISFHARAPLLITNPKIQGESSSHIPSSRVSSHTHLLAPNVLSIASLLLCHGYSRSCLAGTAPRRLATLLCSFIILSIGQRGYSRGSSRLLVRQRSREDMTDLPEKGALERNYFYSIDSFVTRCDQTCHPYGSHSKQ